MPRPTPTLLCLALLAACQSAHTDHQEVESAEDRVARIETSNDELRREVDTLRSLVVAQAMHPAGAAIAGGGVGATPELEVLARLAGLSQQIARLEIAASGVAQPSDASAPIVDVPPESLVPLREALVVLDRQHELHSENLANVSVHGYKRRALRTTTTIHESTGLRLPREARVALDMNQGALEMTGGQLDVGIDGAGFFEIQGPDGELVYTRSGAFQQDVNGRLVTVEGDLLTDQVCFPPDTNGVSISRAGEVWALDDENRLTQIGTMRVHVFQVPADLRPIGGNRFEPTEASGPAAARQPTSMGGGALMQGYLEQSNAELERELIDLQRVERRANAVRRVLATHGIVGS